MINSQSVQIFTTEFLCRLLEKDTGSIYGQQLFEGNSATAGQWLLNAKLLSKHKSLESISCPECQSEWAEVEDGVSNEHISVYCPDCLRFDAPTYLRDVYQLDIRAVLIKLLGGLGLSVMGLKAIGINSDIHKTSCWYLGTSLNKSNQTIMWYFARQLYQPAVSLSLLEQIKHDQATRSAVILTSSNLPLPAGSVLTGFDVRHLSSVAQIERHSFSFFTNLDIDRGQQILDEAKPTRTLRYVKTQGLVFFDGVATKLEPRQRNLLIALIEDRDHEMDLAQLRDKTSSIDEKFSPSKVFARANHIYKAFIRYQKDNGHYALIIPDEDKDWLI